MVKRCFFVGLGLALLIVSFSCKKAEKEQSVEIPAEAVQTKIQGAGAAATGPLLFVLDGDAKDWAAIEPFWAEGGAAGPGPFESNIDIKQVYFKNDAQYLYVFMKISPTIAERFKKSPTGDIIGDLFLDTDSNPKTGADAAEGYESDLYKGYEVRVHIPVGVITSSGQSSPYVAYEVYTHEGGFYGINYADRQNSSDEGSLISHGPDGVELAIRLEAMKLTAPATFRVLLAEQSHFAGEEGHSVGQLTLEAAK